MKRLGIKDLARAIVNEEIDIPDNAIVVTDPRLAKKMLSKKKIELIEEIKRSNPDSQKELAQKTKRKKQAVERDLRVLERLDIISLEKRGRKVKPKIEKEILVVGLC